MPTTLKRPERNIKELTCDAYNDDPAHTGRVARHMPGTVISRALAVIVLMGSLLGCSAKAQPGGVPLIKTPDGGIQPQSVVSPGGVIHLIYFKGDPEAGDIFYVRQEAGAPGFSKPMRVNSQAGSAIAAGTIRGAQIAVGKDERVHVAWNGSAKALPKGPGGPPMLYARLNEAGTAFEPQRNLITWAGGIDGGGSVAADQKGNVYVTWHAMAKAKSEAERAVFLARSRDNGKTFERETQANPKPTGACACCGMRAFVDSRGDLAILYRAAGESVDRDTTLLLSRNQGKSFASTTVHRWKRNACPMSSYALTEGPKGAVLAAWETEGQVYWSRINPATGQSSPPIAAPGRGRRKHPVVAADAQGRVLLAWTEGTGWNQGGSLAWQVYEQDGTPTTEKGQAPGVPVWGLLSAVARPDGSFALLH